jgi:soluble lytic murein transglycosylase-like protein
VQLDRANAIMSSSAKYQIPADLAADIYDIALSEGIDPALGFQLVKIESNFQASARSNMGALG